MLALAGDSELPLLERVKLCAIFSSNLDEFVAVRLAGIRHLVETRTRRRFADGRTPRRTLRDVRRRIAELQAIQDQLWLEDLRPALRAEGIRVGVAECSPREQQVLTKRFEREIEPLLTPIAVGVAAPFPYVTSLALNIGLLVRDRETGEERFIRVNVPNDLGRFVSAGGHGVHGPLEEAILEFRAPARWRREDRGPHHVPCNARRRSRAFARRRRSRRGRGDPASPAAIR